MDDAECNTEQLLVLKLHESGGKVGWMSRVNKWDGQVGWISGKSLRKLFLWGFYIYWTGSGAGNKKNVWLTFKNVGDAGVGDSGGGGGGGWGRVWGSGEAGKLERG